MLSFMQDYAVVNYPMRAFWRSFFLLVIFNAGIGIVNPLLLSKLGLERRTELVR